MHEELSLSPISLWQNNLDHTYTLLTEITRTPPPCRRTDRHSLTRTREPDTQLVVRNLKQRAVRTLQTGGQLQIRTEYPWFQTASYIQRDKIDFNFWAPLASKTPCIIDTLRYYQSPLPMNTKKLICMYPTVGPNFPRNVTAFGNKKPSFHAKTPRPFLRMENDAGSRSFCPIVQLDVLSLSTTFVHLMHALCIYQVEPALNQVCTHRINTRPPFPYRLS